MRITEAAEWLGTTPRMLRYRESLGLLPALRAGRSRRAAAASGAGHRQFSDADVAAVALGLSIERRYDIGPVALAFAIRVLADQRVRADVAELGRRIGQIQPPPARALAFEQERAQRLLNLEGRRAGGDPGNPAVLARRTAPGTPEQGRRGAAGFAPERGHERAR